MPQNELGNVKNIINNWISDLSWLQSAKTENEKALATLIKEVNQILGDSPQKHRSQKITKTAIKILAVYIDMVNAEITYGSIRS